MVIPSIASDERLRVLKKHLTASSGVVHVSGLWGSSAPMLAAFVAATSKRLHLYVSAHLEQADNARDDLDLFRPDSAPRCDLFPAWETLPGEGAASGEIDAERLGVCARLATEPPDPSDAAASNIIVAPIQALMQPVPTPESLERNTLRLRVGVAGASYPTGKVGLPTGETGLPSDSPEALLVWLLDRGFERLDLVESPGDVAKRGDIVDIFVPGEQAPYRIQFLDDEPTKPACRIESIRRFDVGTQRSIASLTTIRVTAMPDRAETTSPTLASQGWGTTGPTTTICAYLPADTLVILDEPGELQTLGETLEARLGVSDRQAGFTGQLHAVRDVLAELERFPQLHLTAFGSTAVNAEHTFDAGVTSIARFEGNATDAVAELSRLAHEKEIHVICDTEGDRDRLATMIDECAEGGRETREAVHLSLGVMHRGFEWTATSTVVIPHHEIFRRQRPRRIVRKLYAGRPVESWLDLNPGEFVVHVLHGIAKYQGLKKLRKGNSRQQEEFLTLEFADSAMVYVPCSQIDLVQKYIGAGGRKPELSKLGGKRWDRAKQKAADSVAELAESLLTVQAARENAVGKAFPADTEWQREFEAAFPYQETEDQTIVAGEIRNDLTRPRPMDRLVCGDVGYGKTELAMRAAFKVVEYGAQVAVLVPTTVLAEQHHQTFRERLAEYPFEVACLSRFRKPSEQRKILEQLRKGQIDIVIGTHRLVSKDVSFANLGLVIIDEEQRFGVEHKERFKAMRETVDVLTLTATPIPRTLHMALMGIRDISSLQSPPVDRRAIATLVRPFNAELIREGILREMNRGGQVFFLHNFVRSIAGVADRISRIVPEARIGFAHGQMSSNDLESVMTRFLRRELDVLVTTTIIESGIDIPTANTIFIDRADRFGLADLHQLRGRVGRSDHRAYCYLLIPTDRPPTPKAAKRLKTIEEFSELGAGFRIAMRDLEIRGAGNLLGAEQSGNIAAVGYEMYCRLLEQTVRRLKNEPDPVRPVVQVDLDVAAHVPRQYIAADRSRIEVYRRLVTCGTESELDQFRRDLVDTFGPYPHEVRRLLEVAEIRVLARLFGIQSISLRPPDVVFGVENARAAREAFKDAPGTVRMPDSKTIHLRLPPGDLEPESPGKPVLSVVRILRQILRSATSRKEAVS